MPPDKSPHIAVIGAGSAGLVAARELAQAGLRVTILEARDRCGGRIWQFGVHEFGYEAEGGAEFIHGDAPVTMALLREAGLTTRRSDGVRWAAPSAANVAPRYNSGDEESMHQKLRDLKQDMPIAQFLTTYFPGEKYAALRQSITRMAEGYDAADPNRASTFALRDEWLGEGLHGQGRVRQGYGAMIRFLEAQCRTHGVELRFGAEVTAIRVAGGKAVLRCGDGPSLEADAVIVTVPLPNLARLTIEPLVPEKQRAIADIGYGDVVKLLLRFEDMWWLKAGTGDMSRVSFFFGDERVPTWWSQYPEPIPVLTGWLAGPRAEKVRDRSEAELIEIGLTSLANMFGLTTAALRAKLVFGRALHWGQDPFALGAYSYATPETRAAQAELEKPAHGIVYVSGEAIYAGHDMGTVEAALAHGLNTARALLKARVR